MIENFFKYSALSVMLVALLLGVCIKSDWESRRCRNIRSEYARSSQY